MHKTTGSLPSSPRLFMAGAWGFICLMIIGAPVLVSFSYVKAGTVLYLCFSPFCHQIADRSFTMFGFPLAVCHRCFGLYLGLFFGSFCNNSFACRSPRVRRAWILCAGMLLLSDVLLSRTPLWQGTCVSRFATGLV
jgi:uncharacterized membrane protein